MRQLILSLLVLPSLASAASLFELTPVGDCKLMRGENRHWVPAQFSEIMDSRFETKPEKARPDYSLFQVKGTWYSVKNSCLSPVEEGAPLPAAGTMPVENHSRSFFLEGRGIYSLMTAGWAKGETVAAGDNSLRTGKYQPDLGYAVRAGYWLTRELNVFLEFQSFGAKQDISITQGGSTLTGGATEKILNFNVGLQRVYAQSGWFRPYTAFSLGYSKVNWTMNLGAAPTSYRVAATGSNLNVVPEIGTIFAFTDQVGLSASVTYTILSFGKRTFTESNYSLFPAGKEVPDEASYGHFGFSLGLRYDF